MADTKNSQFAFRGLEYHLDGIFDFAMRGIQLKNGLLNYAQTEKRFLSSFANRGLENVTPIEPGLLRVTDASVVAGDDPGTNVTVDIVVEFSSAPAGDKGVEISLDGGSNWTAAQDISSSGDTLQFADVAAAGNTGDLVECLVRWEDDTDVQDEFTFLKVGPL
jgi:hypothetical protein